MLDGWRLAATTATTALLAAIAGARPMLRMLIWKHRAARGPVGEHIFRTLLALHGLTAATIASEEASAMNENSRNIPASAAEIKTILQGQWATEGDGQFYTLIEGVNDLFTIGRVGGRAGYIFNRMIIEDSGLRTISNSGASDRYELYVLGKNRIELVDQNSRRARIFVKRK